MYLLVAGLISTALLSRAASLEWDADGKLCWYGQTCRSTSSQSERQARKMHQFLGATRVVIDPGFTEADASPAVFSRPVRYEMHGRCLFIYRSVWCNKLYLGIFHLYTGGQHYGESTRFPRTVWEEANKHPLYLLFRFAQLNFTESQGLSRPKVICSNLQSPKVKKHTFMSLSPNPSHPIPI